VRSYTDFTKADRLVNQAFMAGLNSLGQDVRKRAIILAPKDTGWLRSTAKVDLKSNGETVEISFNTPYAKRRHYENNLHPSTRLYLSNALKSITNVGNYFKRSF
jgi:hypothetical protein